MFKGIQRCRHGDFRRAVVVHQLAYHRQQRNLPHDDFKPWPGQANIQLTVVISDGNLARIVAEAA